MSTVPDRRSVDLDSFDYVLEQDVSVPLRCQSGTVRANVYRPKSTSELRCPVLVTYGPYGKDVPYSRFHPDSFSELDDEQKSPHSAWETPDPGFWTRHGYAIVRADEVGLGQSPGFMDTMSRSTSQCFADVIEWAADQSWSNGKIGLLGVSYYAGSQWRVAARRPRGLCCIVPWEGMSDYYRDRCRHGGILSNAFIDFWWNRQVVNNQYGLAGRAARGWGSDTLEGDRSPADLESARHDQRLDNERNSFHDNEYYASRDYNMNDIKVPILSVGNWGGIALHLRGNVQGYMHAGSEIKYLRLITGRHDLPFYSKEGVAMQLSFLNGFLKGVDDEGWTTGKAPRVAYKVRKGNPGYNTPEAESSFEWRSQESWPAPSTKYTKYWLTPSGGLQRGVQEEDAVTKKLSYKALGTLDIPQLLTFATPPFKRETEITGHIVAHLSVSATHFDADNAPMDMDLFVTLRHFMPSGEEALYTGTVGDPVPVVKGWLRVSLRKTNPESAKHQPWHPHREYLSSDVEMLVPGTVYAVDVEVWPTNVVVEKGGRLELEVSSGDTQGVGLFRHDSSVDRPVQRFAGENHINFGEGHENWLLLPEVD
ncbi:hypothetical protein LTR87_008731 [Friedmanniomyces endolithicus]|nr:hypothetical protein LTR87_008731 [Friedmanniomyces endolithicus]